MIRSQLQTVACALCLLFGSGSLVSGAEDSFPQGTPLNEWRKISDESVGPRFSPGLVWVPPLKRFVLIGGRISRAERPYDVQSFDPVKAAWFNDLPASAKDRGGDQGNIAQVKCGSYFGMKDEKGLVRPNPAHTMMWYSYAYASWTKKVYVLVCGRTLCYDPVARTWENLVPPMGPTPISRSYKGSLNWGSLWADPLNKELLLFGGGGIDSANGGPGTWVYSTERNTWRKLELEVEPGPRALSPMAGDPMQGKIMLFGGDRLNMVYGDTWIYDCKTRTWAEAQPAVSPPPRFGHGLLYLPKSQKFLLAGGKTYDDRQYGRVFKALPVLDTWVYDVASNAWHLLNRKEDKDLPKQKPVEASVMAASDDDTVLFVPGDGHSQRMVRTTWIFRSDVKALDKLGTSKYGAKPGSTMYRAGPYDPSWFAQGVPEPDVNANEAFLSGVAPNRWVKVDAPKWLKNRWPGGGWSTVAFDSDNDELLYHGGGHSAYFGDDVAHYSIKENRWSISYRPSFPLEHCGKLDGPGPHSFTRAPWGNHNYHAYAYDPACKRLVYLKNRIPLYDPVKREWMHRERTAYPFEASKYRCLLVSTPHGVVCWAGKRGLYRFGRDRTWKQLPIKGDLPSTLCDGSALVYDSMRDCLYMTSTPTEPPSSRDPRVCGQVWCYEMKSGAIIEKNPKGMSKIFVARFAREGVYAAKSDLVVFGYVFRHEGRRVMPFYDPKANRWMAASVPGDEFVSAGGKRREDSVGATVDLGLAYDARRDLVWGVLGELRPGSLNVLRVDRASLNLVSLED